jgi:hypothetical protein
MDWPELTRRSAHRYETGAGPTAPPPEHLPTRSVRGPARPDQSNGHFAGLRPDHLLKQLAGAPEKRAGRLPEIKQWYLMLRNSASGSEIGLPARMSAGF